MHVFVYICVYTQFTWALTFMYMCVVYMVYTDLFICTFWWTLYVFVLCVCVFVYRKIIVIQCLVKNKPNPGEDGTHSVDRSS